MNGVDLDEAFSAAFTAGATPVSASTDAIRPGVRYAYNKDPEDNLIEVIQRGPLVSGDADG